MAMIRLSSSEKKCVFSCLCFEGEGFFDFCFRLKGFCYGIFRICYPLVTFLPMLISYFIVLSCFFFNLKTNLIFLIDQFFSIFSDFSAFLFCISSGAKISFASVLEMLFRSL